MGFKSLIAKQVQGAFKIVGSDADGLAPLCTYTSVDQSATAYDTTTRRVTKVVTSYDGIPVILVRFSIEDMNSEIKPQTDRKALIASLNLPCVPNEQDIITTGDGSTYAVHKILSDPADALLILHIRRTA
jgi:hypothetical protein